jgi:hypothetical protein
LNFHLEHLVAAANGELSGRDSPLQIPEEMADQFPAFFGRRLPVVVAAFADRLVGEVAELIDEVPVDVDGAAKEDRERVVAKGFRNLRAILNFTPGHQG